MAWIRNLKERLGIPLSSKELIAKSEEFTIEANELARKGRVTVAQLHYLASNDKFLNEKLIPYAQAIVNGDEEAVNRILQNMSQAELFVAISFLNLKTRELAKILENE